MDTKDAKYWKVTYDNSGVITVQAPDQESAYKVAEDKAQDHGWNLKAMMAEQLGRKD